MKELNGYLPWTKSCFVCGQDNQEGFRLRSRVEHGHVILEYTTVDTDVGYRHLVHGGIAMTLLDEVMTWAAILATGKICVAAEMTTRLKKPIAVGNKLRIEGWVSRNAKRLLTTEGRIVNDQQEILVESSGKYVPIASEKASLCAEDFVHHLHVISPEKILYNRKQGADHENR